MNHTSLAMGVMCMLGACSLVSAQDGMRGAETVKKIKHKPRHGASDVRQRAQVEVVEEPSGGSLYDRSTASGEDDDALAALAMDYPRRIVERSHSVEYKLAKHLLDGYQKKNRPVVHPNDPVYVSVVVFLYQVIRLDQTKNTIILSGSFELIWQDSFLQWNPEDFDNATEIFLSSDDVWTPELSLYYSHHHSEGGVVMKTNNDVRLNYTGHLRYYIPFTTESLCPINVQFFPFDNQTCKLFFGSWAHPNTSLSFDFIGRGLEMEDFYDNQEWVLEQNRSKSYVEIWKYSYIGVDEFWRVITIEIAVKRQSFYYVFNLVVPSTMIVIVAVIGFHSPSTSGRVRDAKFRLGIMTLMSMSVILLAVVEDMPKFAMNVVEDKKRGSFSGVPLIGLFYFCLLSVAGLSTITTSLFVYLERDVKKYRMIPWYLRWLDCGRCQNKPGYRLTETIDCTVPSTFVMSKWLLQQFQNNSTVDTPRAELRKRLSVAHYDNMVVYQYFHQLLEDLTQSIHHIQESLDTIRHEMMSVLPKDDLDTRWFEVIRRLELLSLSFYLGVIAVTCFLFVEHQWWYG